MLNSKKQINKGTVKDQKDRAEIKKKTKTMKTVMDIPTPHVVSKVWECLCCSKKVICTEKPTECPCSNPNYVVNIQYKVKE